MSRPSLEAEHVSVQYGEYRALKDVSLTLPRGQYALLIGENGAGKSTLLRCLAGWQRPQGGVIMIEGMALEKHEREARRSIKLVSDTPQFYAELTAWEHVSWVARVHRIPSWTDRAQHLMETLGLAANRQAYPGSFSRGMQYKLGLVMALITQPNLLLLDEPFGPLDPYSQEYVAQQFAALSHSGVTVLASTHVLPDTEPPSRILVLDQGRLIADHMWDEVESRYGDTSPAMVPVRVLKDALAEHRDNPHA